jgi:hypothetical protein
MKEDEATTKKQPKENEQIQGECLGGNVRRSRGNNAGRTTTRRAG